jgi:antitoxin (DNA-binding transcriptional repressor) of toxin-antitoxin stability system
MPYMIEYSPRVHSGGWRETPGSNPYRQRGDPVMTLRTIDITEATQPLAEYAQQADSGPLVVTANGKPIAIVLPIENADTETITLSEHPQFLAIIERSRDRQQRAGGLTSDAVRQHLGLSNGKKS